MQSIRLITKPIFQNKQSLVKYTTSAVRLVDQTNDWLLYPREKEGNNYAVNWSLNEDGVTPVGNAFRNARLQTLLNRVGTKLSPSMESVEVKNAALLSKPEEKLLEAGDSVSHEEFQTILENVQNELSAEKVDLFVEDVSVGSGQKHRIGVRIISDNAALTLASRSLLFPVPPRPVDYRARAKGWNLDPRWENDPILHWDGKEYVKTSTEPAAGQRPIVVYVGTSEKNAVQFIEFNKEIVGANIVLGKSASVQALVQAVGYAGSIILNQGTELALSLPSASFIKAGSSSSTVVVNADNEVIQAATASGASLYGNYFNVLTADSLSTFFRGQISTAKSSQNASFGIPAVVGEGGVTASLTVPDNATFPAKKIIVFDKNSKGASKLSAEEATKTLLAISESNKEDFVKGLVEKAEVHVINNAKDVSKLL